MKTLDKSFTIINGEEKINCYNSADAEEKIFDIVLNNSFSAFSTVEDATSVTIDCL